VLSWFLVFGIAGWPGWGVAGAGYATSLVNAAMVTALAAACFGGREMRSWLPIGALMRGDRAAGRDIFKVGLPVAGMTLAESGMFTVVMVLIGGFGTIALAASKMVFGYVQVAGAFAFAAADAAAIRVAMASGRGDRTGVWRAGMLACSVGTAILVLLAAVPLVFPFDVAAVFLGELKGEDIAVAEQARLLFGIGALYLVLQGLQTIVEHALRGLRDTLVPMWQSLAGLWLVGLAGGALLAYAAGMGVAGLWWGMAAGSGLTALLFLRRFAVLTARIGPAG
jgi:multidrug resistance protein, MATE family